MPAIGPSVLEDYLKRYGWRFNRAGESSWTTGWREGERFYSLAIGLDEHWVSFSVSPLVHLAVEWLAAPDLSKHILELNNTSQMVKLALDEHGHVVMRIQVLGSQFGYEEFSHILGIIGYYAETLGDSITRVVRDRGFPQEAAQTLLT